MWLVVFGIRESTCSGAVRSSCVIPGNNRWPMFISELPLMSPHGYPHFNESNFKETTHPDTFSAVQGGEPA